MKEEKTRKSRTLWWVLLILLLLASFTGGTVLGLKLSTMPGPSVIRDRWMEKMGTAIPALAEPETAVTPEAEPETMDLPEPAPEAETVDLPAPEAETAELPASVPTEVPAAEPASTEAEALPVAEPVPAANNAAAPAYISMDTALESALSHAGCSAEDAQVTGISRVKDDDGKTVYQVSFTVGEFTHEYVIDALTGEVDGFKVSGFSHSEAETYGGHTPIDDFDKVGVEDETAAGEDDVAGEDAAIGESAAPIDEERAKELALEAAGVMAEDAADMTVSLEEGESPVYKVSFTAGAEAFAFTVDAVTGEVLPEEAEK